MVSHEEYELMIALIRKHITQRKTIDDGREIAVEIIVEINSDKIYYFGTGVYFTVIKSGNFNAALELATKGAAAKVLETIMAWTRSEKDWNDWLELARS